MTKSGGTTCPYTCRRKSSALAKGYPGEAKFVQRSRQIRPVLRPVPDAKPDESADPGLVREAVPFMADSLRFDGRA
ncbi:hypothetical protein D477_003128 [Arthrobacter crystallopoietes BAB-32]|uniref:Uncharacterized protein n=1 Tax=Arthrobacter crystallopoietes BAB-32 TaxID=1246476 RepID=N1V6K8_9MICC|nr:hypothetical protein [Arthrobacter crystallopoietes]EMY35654.1 hypothetical protein D477_003128 [Arthrobacter crystallopoietes BAB-32]